MDHCQLLAGSNGHSGSPPHKLCLETSFTSIQPRAAQDNSSSDSRHLPWEFTSLVGSSPAPPLDLIHDDWFGLAPLATPESLSEVSSISSRTSTVKKKQPSVTFVDVPVKHHFTREEYKHDNTTGKSWKCNLKQNFFSAENFICVKSKTQSDSSPENGSLINTSNDKFYSAESMTEERIVNRSNTKEVEHLDEESTSESSPLLSSLHLLTDEKFQNLFKGNLTTKEIDDSISSGSFKSVSSEMRDLSTSMDSVTVNAEVHRTEDKTLWTENSDLLEDIERSLNLRSSDSPCRIGTVSPGDSSADIDPSSINSEKSEVRSLSGVGRNKYVYPILSIAKGESSV